MAWAINKTVFQKTRNPVLRYVWTGLISAGAVMLWLTIATLIASFFRKP